MPGTDKDECEFEGQGNPELYKLYTRWQLCEALVATLFCLAMVVAVASVAIITECKWMAALYVLPTACYLGYYSTR